MTSKRKPLDKFDSAVDRLVCNKCGLIVHDIEPYGSPEFFHLVNPKRYCPNEGVRLDIGTPGVAIFRRKSDRRARTRGARTAWKMTKKNTG